MGNCDMITDVACYSDAAGCSLYHEAERVAALCREQTNCADCAIADDACAWDGSCFSTANSWHWDSAWVSKPQACLETQIKPQKRRANKKRRNRKPKKDKKSKSKKDKKKRKRSKKNHQGARRLVASMQQSLDHLGSSVHGNSVRAFVV